LYAGVSGARFVRAFDHCDRQVSVNRLGGDVHVLVCHILHAPQDQCRVVVDLRLVHSASIAIGHTAVYREAAQFDENHRARYGDPMELTFATPALLFPAVSLLFISYTNRFISYAQLVRRLHEQWQADGHAGVAEQIRNLRRRISLIRNMQIAGATSLVCSVACILFLAFGLIWVADIVFAAALLLMLVSLVFLIVEVSISMKALDLQLSDLECGRDNAPAE
jgi:hypothetical protein